MFHNLRSSRRRHVRPFLHSLEERTLLNAAIPHLSRGMGIPADVFAMKHKHPAPPIVPNLPATPSLKLTTVPANGDVNPYGLAIVPNGSSGGTLQPGQFLVANFNNSANVQGTGTTIVAITPGQNPATAPVFYTSPASETGLSEALEIVRLAGKDFVIVGNVPTTDGTFGTIGAGSLQIINANGQLVQTLTSSTMLDGPWASAVNVQGNTAQLFIANVEGGTVTRIDLKGVKHHGQVSLKVESMTEIASGYTVQANAAAVVVGPGGLAYNSKTGTLYVDSTGDNEVFAVAHAATTHADHGTGTLIYQDPAHLRGPIGLALAPNGDLLATNDDAVNGNPSFPSELIEFTPTGQFVGQLSLDPAQGAAFQILVQGKGNHLTIESLNDDTNTLDFRTTT
jgi:hypothetical protein